MMRDHSSLLFFLLFFFIFFFLFIILSSLCCCCYLIMVFVVFVCCVRNKKYIQTFEWCRWLHWLQINASALIIFKSNHSFCCCGCLWLVGWIDGSIDWSIDIEAKEPIISQTFSYSNSFPLWIQSIAWALCWSQPAWDNPNGGTSINAITQTNCSTQSPNKHKSDDVQLEHHLMTQPKSKWMKN